MRLRPLAQSTAACFQPGNRLPDLTDHDLEKLGVVLGDRRKMLRAIANLEAWKIAPRYDRCHSVASPQSHIAR
jgi:hypothetical protein